MLLGRCASATALCLVASLLGCTASSPEPSRAARVIIRLPEGDAELPETSSDGAPYVFRNVVIGGGGFVSGIVFSPAKAGVAYARSDVGGAYRLDSTRKLWIPLTDMFGRAEAHLMGVESIAPDPADANKVYAAVGSYAKPWAPSGVILRSSDQGSSWQRTEMPIRMGGNEAGRSIGERLAVDPNKTDHLWFGSRKDGLWRSVDAGVTWNKVPGFPQKEDATGLGVGFVVFDARSGARGSPTPVLYTGMASGPVGLYASYDGGEHFVALLNQPAKLSPSHAAFDAQGTLYVSYVDAPGPSDIGSGAVYRYDPRHRRFTDITPLSPNASDRFGYGGLAVDIQHPGTLLATTIGRFARGDEIFRSIDGGRRWSALLPKAVRVAAGFNYLYFGHDKLGAPGWMGDIDIDPFDANHVVHVCGQGVWASEDLRNADKGQPVHFRFRVDGLEQAVVQKLVSPPAGAPLISGVADICGFRHDDLSKPAQHGMHSNPICNTTSGLDYAAHKPELLVRVGTAWGADKHGAFSRDGGVSWAPFASEPAGAESGGLIAMSADGATLWWSHKRGAAVFSKDYGKSWSKVSGLPDPVEAPPEAPLSLQLASDRVNPLKVYAFDAGRGQLYTSGDAGEHFEPARADLPELADWARPSCSIQAMPGVEGDVWVSTGKALLRSTDSGKTFEPLANAEEGHAVGFGKAAPGRLNPSVFLVGKVAGAAGIFRSDDLGKTFVRINDDQHQFGFVQQIIGDPRRFGRVYLGTAGRGVLVGDPH